MTVADVYHEMYESNRCIVLIRHILLTKIFAFFKHDSIWLEIVTHFSRIKAIIHLGNEIIESNSLLKNIQVTGIGYNRKIYMGAILYTSLCGVLASAHFRNSCYCCCLGIAPRAKMPKISAWLLHPNW